ncbi:MAG: hypothetical protein MHMPM18_005129 [Marteilia pararefringens]
MSAFANLSLFTTTFFLAIGYRGGLEAAAAGGGRERCDAAPSSAAQIDWETSCT